jgi:hypothetical protein
VACTTLKGGRAEWLVEKATELGAWELTPVITARYVFVCVYVWEVGEGMCLCVCMCGR